MGQVTINPANNGLAGDDQSTEFSTNPSYDKYAVKAYSTRECASKMS